MQCWRTLRGQFFLISVITASSDQKTDQHVVDTVLALPLRLCVSPSAERILAKPTPAVANDARVCLMSVASHLSLITEISSLAS
jgi:hypothetical protein